ncbi:hypothetical protein NT07LI_3830, partial [Listeria innocua FSL S4-378]
VFGSISSLPIPRTIFLTFSEIGLPPGSRVLMKSMPASSIFWFNRVPTVVFPEPSGPSSVIKIAFIS